MPVDATFARERFAAYLALWQEYKQATGDPWRKTDALKDEIVKAQPTLFALLNACDQGESFYMGIHVQSYNQHRQAILRAQGVLDDREELARALGPQGPELRATGLHPWVWETAAPLWDSKHHRQAVAAAAGNLSL